MNFSKKLFLIPLFCVLANAASAQIKVIDNKGTLKEIDTSKWSLLGINIFYKNLGNVGIGTQNPQAKLHVLGNVRFESLGSNTVNTDLLTTNASGDVTYRSLSSLLDGNAITSLNGLTASVQTFGVGNTGTDFNISSSGTVHTFNLPDASATNRGLLTAVDWTAFNNKIGIINGTAPIVATTSGTTTTIGINRNNLLTGVSSNTATSPLALDAGAANAVVGGVDATLTVNNTAPLWNANQLQGRNIAATAPVSGQSLTWDGTAWAPASPTATTVSNTVTAPNSLTTTVNGITGAAVSMVTGVSNTSSVNSLTTAVNGVTSTAVNIINTNVLSAASNAITSTVNGVTATLTPAAGGTVTENLGFNAAGALVRQTVNAANTPNIYTANGTLTGARTVTQGANNLTFNSTTGNLIFNPSSTGRVGIANTSPAERLDVTGNVRFSGALMPAGAAGTSGQVLSSAGSGAAPTWVSASSLPVTVSNVSNVNTLTTTVNGVTGTGVNIINGNALSTSGSNLVSTVNGVSSSLSIPTLLNNNTTVSNNSNVNTLTTTVNGVTGTGVNIINSNALSTSGSNLVSSVNGVSSSVSIPTLLSENTTNSLSVASGQLTSNVNGVSSSVNVSSLLNGSTTVSNASNVNTLTTTVNGVTGTGVNIINSNALSTSGSNLVSTVNGVSSSVSLSGLLGNATTVSNTVTSPNSLTTTVNGVTGSSVSMVTGVSNNSNVNTLTTTVNGVTGTGVNIINSNTLSAAGSKITSIVNGVSSDLTPALGTIAQNLGFDASGNLVKAAPTTASGWLLGGNAGTTAGTNFIGTTDNQDLVFKTNNVESGRISIFNQATSLGMSSLSEYRSTNIGFGAGTSGKTESVAVGYNAQGEYQSVAVGSAAQNSNTSSVAVGNASKAAYQSVAVGQTAEATQNGTVALGQNAKAITNQNATALGQNSSASGQNSTAVGQGATASATNATAIGYNTTASQNNTLILGNGANVGIGTSTPTERLQVTGNVRFSGALMPNNAAGTSGQVLTSAGAGAAPTWTSTSSLPVTVANTVTAPNSLTTTVNGVTGAAVSMVTGVSNASSNNSLTTTVNGVTGTAVNIINANTLTAASNAITSTVNGVTATLTPTAGGTIAENLGFNAAGNLVRQTISAANTPNIYTADGTLTGARTITMGSNALNFRSNSTSSLATVSFGRTIFEMDMGVAGQTGDGLVGTAAGDAWLAGGAFGGTNRNLFVGTRGTGALNVVTGATAATQGTRMIVTSAGNVGIGTTSPSQILDVNGTVKSNALTNGATLIGGSGDFGIFNQTNNWLRFTIPSGSTFGWFTDAASGNGFYGSSNAAMTLTGSGNLGLGIGSSAASERLQVGGNIRFSGALMPNNAAGTAGQVLTSAGAGAAPTWTNATTQNIYNTNGTLTGARTITTNGNPLNIWAGSTNNAYITFGRTAYEMDMGISGGPGNGLSPTVAGDGWVKSTTNLFVGTQGSGSFHVATGTPTQATRLFINSTGNVGIGTTSPGQILDVNGTLKAARLTNGTGALSTVDFGLYSQNNNWMRYATAAGNHMFFTDASNSNGWAGSTPSMVLTSAGRLGVNTSAPDAVLTVRGTNNQPSVSSTTNASFRIEGNSNHVLDFGTFAISPWGGYIQSADRNFLSLALPLILQPVDGRVGIGTISPSEKLDVAGNVRFSGALMPNNSAGTSGQVLTSAGPGAPPVWSANTYPQILVVANRTSTYTIGTGYATLVYNSASTNIGTAYNTSTGEFTAPADGMYQILFNNSYSYTNYNINTMFNRVLLSPGAGDIVDTEVANGSWPENGGSNSGTITVNGTSIFTLTSGQKLVIQQRELRAASNPTALVGAGQHLLKIIRLK